jgi:hypothetical protein
MKMPKWGILGWLVFGYLALMLVGLVLVMVFQYWYIAVLIVAGLIAVPLIRHIRMKKYFSSPEFLAHLEEISAVVAEHNEVSAYVNEIRETGRFTIGKSSTAVNAHLANYENRSKFGYKRDRNQVDLSSKHVHHASLQVVRNASLEPIKYLIKYFDISATEEKLAEIEELGESISRLENAVNNLGLREKQIADSVSPPPFILKHYLKEFQAKVGLSIPQLSIPYPIYKFEYVSAGGNSAQVAEIKLTSATIDALIEELSEKIKFKKSAAGQRALMTAKFRDFIKRRDNFECRICFVSLDKEPTLLLEVDHIKPLSKGGMSTEDNLQTLCWKCNRSKASKY